MSADKLAATFRATMTVPAAGPTRASAICTYRSVILPSAKYLRLFASLAVLMAGVSALADQAVTEAIRQYNALSQSPLPFPDSDALEQISAGKHVIVRERKSMTRSDGTSHDGVRVIGYQLVHRPRLLVWLAALDVGTQHSNRLVEHLLEFDDRGGSLWYQFLNTPWPVRNRHWVIRNTKSVAVAHSSDERIWEHNWRLEDDGASIAGNVLRAGQVIGLQEQDGAAAIYLSINRGAWTMFQIDDDTTLVAAHTAADLGGWIPESWVARFVARQLGSVLANLEVRSDDIHERYTGRYPIFSGAGTRLTPDMAVEERARYEVRGITE